MASRRRGRPNCSPPPGPGCRSLRPTPAIGSPRSRPTRDFASKRAPGRKPTSKAALIALLETEDDDEAQRFRAAARARRRARQRHRPTGVLRLLVRIDRRALAAGHRRLDRRRGAGVRPGGAFARRGDRPRDFARLGRGGARLATALGRLLAEPPPRDLARFRRPRLRQCRPAADRGGFRGAVFRVDAARPADRRRNRRRRRRSPDAARGAGVAGGRSCHRGRRRCRRALRDFGRREASVERCPKALARRCARRRRSASPAARRWSSWSPATGAARTGAAPKSCRASRHEPVRVRPRLLRGAGHRARRLAARRGGTVRDAQTRSAAWRGQGVEAVPFRRRRRAAVAAGVALVSIPPDAAGDPTLRALRRALRQPSLRRVVYLSTVGVYGDSGGDWVDEASPLRPATARARARVAGGGGVARVRPRERRRGRHPAPRRHLRPRPQRLPAAARRDARAGWSSPGRCSTASMSTTSPRRWRRSPLRKLAGEVYNVVDGARRRRRT